MLAVTVTHKLSPVELLVASTHNLPTFPTLRPHARGYWIVDTERHPGSWYYFTEFVTL